jgi:hypothetical protein
MFKYKVPLLFFLVLFYGACVSDRSLQNTGAKGSSAKGSFTLPQQFVRVDEVKSVQFYRSSNEQNPPVIELNSSEKLRLSFDALTDFSQQYRIEFTHHDKDWRRSILLPEEYLSGLQEAYITGGQRNLLNRPRYFSYSTEFPNRNIGFRVSGNYLMHVYDQSSNRKIMVLPFFVHENQGEISSRVEKLFTTGFRGRAQHQLFSDYTYPDFIQFPQFDLHFAFAQNQFWGLTQYPTIFSTIGDGMIEFHQSRQEAYPADFEFNTVDLSNLSELSSDAFNFLDFDQASVPPSILLREDVQNLSADTIRTRRNRFGIIKNSRDSQYLEATFSFIPRFEVSNDIDLFLTGDFIQWQILPEYRLEQDTTLGWWQSTALLKQGSYAYKYVIVRNGNLDFLSTEDGYTRSRQEYQSFVYYYDPNRNFFRLLSTMNFTAD